MSCNQLWTVRTLKRFLEKYEIYPKREKGQHFLHQKSTLESIASTLEGGEGLIEIGAGAGNLTCLLKDRFREVWAVEIDQKLKKPFVENLGAEEGVTFLQRDFLSLDLTTLPLPNPERTKVAGNIPYNLTAPLIKKIIYDRHFYTQSVLTLQKEVASKLTAEPGSPEASSITFLVRPFAEVTPIFEIPPEAFYPPPEVTSTVLKLDFFADPLIRSNQDTFLEVVRAAFNYRRKTIRNALTTSRRLGLGKSRVDKILKEARICSGRRPEELNLEQFDRLAEILERTAPGEGS